MAEALPPSVSEAAYLEDIDAAYRTRFRARVQSRPPGALVLDRTYFYPEGGGQPSDQGHVTGPDGRRFPVTDVRRSGDEIVHRLGRSEPAGAVPPGAGEEVEGEIDWERRHRHMRLHTAQHLVSGLAFSLGGIRTRQARMSGTTATIDLDGPWPSDLDRRELERRWRSIELAPRAVRIDHVPRAEWDRTPSPRAGIIPIAARIDPVRVIEIEGVDRCPCGGTHVRSTSEIGRLEITWSEAQPPAPGDRIVLRLLDASVQSERVTP
ncbi:MAG TPA: alanyl-tRNA editing protein [Thermoplasmata archaeon]|nr:alanyl-tRNA editing protein [Thermoplasmata archaeon]